MRVASTSTTLATWRLARTATAAVNEAKSFTATVTNDSNNQGVTWALSGTGCTGAACGTLSATSSGSGVAIVYTAPATVPSPATVTLTAKSVGDGSKTSAATITIVAASGTVSVVVSPKRAAVTTGQLQTFSAVVSGNVNTAVTWEVDSVTGGSSTLGVISAAGIFTPSATAGTHVITARSTADTTASASATIAVTDLAGVFTYHNDLSRDGSNSKEYALTPATVTSATFGKQFSCAVDASAYPQPLWVANVAIGGGTHNVVIAATEHDTIYAFDADASPCTTYWTSHLLAAGETWLSLADTGGVGDLAPDIGIVGTPVIDPATKIIYVVSKSKNGTTFHQRLHALKLSDGTETLGGPVEISYTVGTVPFNPLRENQRSGLALVNGVVYIAWGSHEDILPYYGWLAGYRASDLTLVGTPFNVDPVDEWGGIWMSGGAPAADANNNLFVITGNGEFNVAANEYGDSFLKLATPSTGPVVSSYFSPSNQLNLQTGDQDLGSGGAAILVDQTTGPHAHLVIGGGKDGALYLLDRDNLGGFSPTNAGIVQALALGHEIYATPAFWQNRVYVGLVQGNLVAFDFDPATGLFGLTPSSQSATSYGFPGATPSISSQGTSNGIVWTIERGNTNAILHAYDANNVATQLWDSTQGAGNAAGVAVKFTVPTVANGKVYVGTAGEITVYGLLPN